MKKIALILAVVMLLTFTATGCAKVRGVEIDYGTSKMYTKMDMQDALPCIFGEFTMFFDEKETLSTLTFAGDEKCQQRLAKWKTRTFYKIYDQCMVFDSTIKVQYMKYNNGDPVYRDKKVTWLLGKVKNEDWEVVNWIKTK